VNAKSIFKTTLENMPSISLGFGKKIASSAFDVRRILQLTNALIP